MSNKKTIVKADGSIETVNTQKIDLKVIKVEVGSSQSSTGKNCNLVKGKLDVGIAKAGIEYKDCHNPTTQESTQSVGLSTSV